MKHMIIGLISIIILSCSQNNQLIYYSYDNIYITRIDRGNDIFLYYGKYVYEEELPKSYIRASYQGFDGLMNGFLIFKENGEVEVVKVEGNFNSINDNEKLRLIEFEQNIDFINWEKKIKGNYNNTIELSDVIKDEVKRNIENNSNVKAFYPTN